MRGIKKVSAFAVLLTFVFTYLHFRSSEKKSEPEIILGDGYAAGDNDNPYARYEYERMMLMDPATGEIPAGIRERELEFATLLPSVDDDASRSSISWTNRGPWNVGGMTRALAMDVNNENVMIAGTNSGSLWRTTDGGTTWAETTPKNVYHGITCLAQDKRPGHSNVWYYGSGDPWASASGNSSSYYTGTGMYKSLDSGMTWTSLPSTATGNLQTFDNVWDIIYRIVPDKSNTVQDVVYAATYGCIFRSVDGGNAWTLVRGGSASSPYFTNVELTSTGIVYATLSSDGLHAGIWRSVDGINYVSILPAGFPATFDRMVSAIAPSNENIVYFICNTPGFGTPDTNFLGTVEWNSLWKYTYLSGDGSGSGGMWQDLSSSLPTMGGTFDKFQCQGSYDLIIKVKPDDPNTVFLGGTNLYRSTDGFADTLQTTFIGGYEKGCEFPYVRSYLNHHPDQHEILFLPSNPNILFSGNDGGMFRTDNCLDSLVTWTSLDNGYLTAMFYTVALDHATANSNVIIGGTQDNGTWYTRSTNSTSPWTHPGGGDGSFCYVANNESAFYTSVQNGKVYRGFLDTTGAVTAFSRIDPIGGHGYLFVNPFTIDPNNNNRMYLAGGSALWRNNDLSGIPMNNTFDSISTNWFMFPDTLTTVGIKITALAVSNIPANRLYVGTNKGKVYRINNANTDTAVFTNITSTTPNAVFPSNGYVSCVAVDPSHADNVIVVFSNYSVYSLFYTNNGGTSWKKIAGNLEQFSSGGGNGPSCRWASIMPVTNGNVYLVGTSIGLYATNFLDSINTVWYQQGANTIGRTVVPMLDTRFSDGIVAVATHANGIYTASVLDFNDVVGISQKENAVLNISASAFPNPSSDVVFIRYQSKKSGDVELNIMDNNGRLVKRIIPGNKDAGRHEVSLDASSLKTGLYFAVLKSSYGESAVTKFVVTR